ncbi:MAG: heavy-metal-associated domain-containing protein [Candidatus Izemoplasmatales bacterium]
MKRAIIEGMCCEGCARDVKKVLEGIYGITDVRVFLTDGYATFEGFVSKDVIAASLADEGYRLVSIEKQ